MRLIHHLVIAGLAPVLVNCSTHPLVDDVTRVTTSDIVRHIRCEAQRAVVHEDIRSNNASADTTLAIAYDFNFNITENNNAKGDITWQLPFLNEGSNFQLLANADAERQRSSVRTFRIVETFDNLRTANCSAETLEKNLPYPIAGEIGIYDVVTTFARLQTVASRKKGLGLTLPHQPSTIPDIPDEALNKVVFRFADTLTFMTTFSGGVTPTLTLAPVPNSFRVTDVNKGFNTGLTPSGLNALQPGLNAQRQDTHTVIIAMAGVPKKIDQIRSRANIAAPPSPHSLTSTTLYQLQATAKERALYELDRQRLLALQQQSPNLLVGP
jgi:hypothetical protein